MANEFKIKKGLIVTGASGGTVVDIQGSQGQLFSVTDNLSGSIFAVSDISGVPILDINSSGLSTFDGNLSISEFIYHTGDIGTSIQMIPGQMVLKNSGGKYINLHSNGTTYFESSAYQFNTGNATFAGNVDVNGGQLKIQGDFAKLLFEDTAGTDLDSYIVNNANGLFFGKTNSPSSANDILSLNLSTKAATFAGEISQIYNPGNTGAFQYLKNANSGSSAYVSKKWQNDDAGFGEIWRNSSTRNAGAGNTVSSFNMYNSAAINFWPGGNLGLTLDASQNATFAGKITANGGINGLTLANGGITGSNYDITGVNQLVISDPGEGIVFTGTTTMYLNAVDDATDSILKLTNATQLNLNSTARITNLVNPTGAQDAATKNYVDTEIGNIPSGLAFEGNWNASTDTPSLAGTTQDNGKFWIVSVAGSTNLSGITDWAVGDWAIYVDNGAGTDAWQKVDNSSSLAGQGSAGKVTFWSSTSNVSFNNNFTYDGTYLTSPRIQVGDGTDGYFWSDTAGRTAFAAGDFYIQNTVTNYYNYATRMYLGDTTGDSVLFRGSTITGTNWGITPAGAATFAGSITVGTDANIDNNLTVSGGNITLGGTGRIQGVDTVSASTDATNKTYVDSNFAKRYSFDIGSSGGARRYIKLWTMTDTDDGVSGFLSMSGDYGDNDKGAYQLLVGTRGGNISMDVFETSIGGISDNFEFFYKDIGTSYEIWMLASDYNYPGQTAFLPIATFGGVTYNFDSITTTTPSGLVSVSNISFVNTVQAQSIGGAKTFTTTPISVTRSTADNSTYLATTAFVKNQGYTSNTGTITGGGQNLRLALWNGSTSIGSDGDFTYNGDTIFTTKLSVQNQINTNSANLEINYANGDGTTTNFKNFDIRDGKNAIITSFEGSTKNVTNRGNNFLIGGNFANNSYNSTSGARLLFGGGNSDSLTNYYIGTNIDNFGGSYTKLDLAWHTGIRIGAQGQYGGVRIYNNEDFSTVLFSVGSGNGETGVSVTNSLTVGAAIRTNTYQDFSGNILFLAGNTTTGASRSLNLRNSGSTSDPSSSDDSLSTGITWGQRSDSTPYYVIYPNLENWNSSGNFSKLTLAWHTGIKIGAASGYGGTRFYNNSPDVSGAAVILNVGVGNSNIGVVNNLTVGGQATGPAPTTTTSYANKAYVDGLADDDITALAFSGTTTQTLTATQRDTSTLTASFNITKIKAGGNGPSTENLNTVANSVSVGELEYRGFNSSSSNIPPVSDNANGVITVGQHSGNYNAQLAFSSDGNMYWRDNPGSSFGSWGKILDANNTPNGPFLPLAGGVMSGKIGRSSAIVGFLEGSYNNVGANGLNTNPIYTIGSSYNPASTTLSNMYGVGYTSAAASFITLTGASNWGFYVAADGDARVWLDGSNGNISAAGTIYASGGNSGQWNTHTSNTGTVTSVATGGGLDGGTITTTGTIEVEYTAVPTNIIQSGFDFTGDTVVSGDYIMISDPGQTTTNRRIGYVTVGDLPFTNNSGDITAVTAGTGMTGGGTSGSVTLNVIGGTGITANANDVAIDYAGSDSIVMAAPGGNSPDADDYIIYGADSSGGGESAKVQFIDIPLSVFDNDVGFITNSGVVLTSGTQSISGSKTFTTQVIAADFEMTAVQSRAKLSVWAGSTYGFGMQTGYTFGGLGNDYAITCQMSNTATRGFWWGDNGHSNAHGAMALTTTGLLTVASAIRLGYGEADTTSPGGTYKLDVSGNTLMNGVGVVRSSDGVGDFYLGNYATANHFRFHTNNSQTYFDMNCGQINWRDGSSIRYYFYPSTANMTINGTLTQNSDSRVKENVVEIGNCISKVQAMRGVYYNRTDFNTEVTKVGVIAQEVEAVLPELILEASDTGLKSVAYAELTAVLINAIKEQQEIIEDLKTRITKLEN